LVIFGNIGQRKESDIMPLYKSKTPTKDGRAWFFKISYVDNLSNVQKFVSKKYKTKGEASEEERKYLNAIDENRLAPDSMTIGDLWRRWMEYQDSKVRISTKNGYKHTEKYVRNLFNIKCVSFSLQNYEDWRKYLDGCTNLNDVSKNDKQKVLRALLNFGRKHYNFDFYRITSMMVKFDNPNEIKEDHNVYSPEEFIQYLSAEPSQRFRVLWLTLYYCGLRIGEARGLQWKDIDWDTKTVWINKQIQSIDNYDTNYFMAPLKTPKSNRKLPLCTALYQELRDYYDEVSQFGNFTDEFFVFGENFGITPLPYNKARRRKNKIASDSGVKQIRLHDFRHSCASLLIHKGTPIAMVSKYMGHASITETLNTYTHMFGSDLQSVTSAFDDIVVGI